MPKTKKFNLDPYELDLLGNHRAHFEALLQELPYIWLNTNGQPKDLRKQNMKYLQNLFNWMERESNKDSPYYKTDQYRYVRKKVLENERKKQIAAEILRRGLHEE